MDMAHMLASGMGGIRTAGDLVARMEYAKNMKVDKAKEYVAKKLGLSTLDIADESSRSASLQDFLEHPGESRQR